MRLGVDIDFDNPKDRVAIFLYEQLLAEHIDKAEKEKFSEIRKEGYAPVTNHLLYASPSESTRVPFNLAKVISTIPRSEFSKIHREVSSAHFSDREERISEEVTERAKKYMKENGANNFLLEYRPLDEEVLERIDDLYQGLLHP